MNDIYLAFLLPYFIPLLGALCLLAEWIEFHRRKKAVKTP